MTAKKWLILPIFAVLALGVAACGDDDDDDGGGGGSGGGVSGEIAIDGQTITISAQTICCHGDTPGAPNIVRAVREALEKAGCRVRPLRDWLPA